MPLDGNPSQKRYGTPNSFRNVLFFTPRPDRRSIHGVNERNVNFPLTIRIIPSILTARFGCIEFLVTFENSFGHSFSAEFSTLIEAGEEEERSSFILSLSSPVLSAKSEIFAAYRQPRHRWRNSGYTLLLSTT